jgi:putative membrane protein
MIILSVLITSNPISETENISLLHILVSGIIAASAMILPGISGSLILVILGVYKTLIDALDNLEIEIISSFLIGAIIGLLSFSKILKWLFNNYKNLAYSIMLGLVIGSIEKIWPWKSENIIEITNSEISLSIVLTLTGVLLILVVEKYNKN